MKKYILILTFLLIIPSASADADFELSPLLPVQTKQEKAVKDEVNVKTVEIKENAQEIKEQVSSEIKETTEEISDKTKKNIKKQKKKIKDKTKKIKKDKKKKRKKKSREEIEETQESTEEEVKPEGEQQQTEEVEQKKEDTEHTVEYPQEEEFKFKHELLKVYENKYQENNQDVDNILKLAKIHLDLGQRAIAKSYYMQLYNTYPNSPRIQFEMGKFYYECKQYNAALEFFKLSLASGYLRNLEVNEYTRKTYAKLGDEENEELYSQIIEHLNGNSQTGE